MSVSRETYIITASDVQSLVSQMNFFLARIADRLDQIEALRGKAQMRGELQIIDPDTNAVLHGFTDGS